MKYRLLGRTGLSVSAVSLGTASLGGDYRIAAPGESGRPDDADAVGLLRAAVDRGITLFDTAPAYGDSESLVGRAIGGDARALIATKTGLSDVEASLDASRRALGRDVLDIVQIHNATAAIVEDGRVLDVLDRARGRGVLRFIGASVYGEAAALAAIQSGRVDLVQIALSPLDQRMVSKVLPAAAEAGVGLVARSVLLRGALTPRARWLPGVLGPLRVRAAHACDVLACGRWDDLPAAAIRFCLSVPGVASVLVGVRTVAELDVALAAEEAGPVGDVLMAAARGVAIEDEQLLDPSRWPAP